MSNSMPNEVGTVASLLRYPVKSMMGEDLSSISVTANGLLGDRACALFDPNTGKVVSAKNPRKWPGLFEWRAEFVESPRIGQEVPAVRITLPDGSTLTSTQSDFADVLSKAIGRDVVFESQPPQAPVLEEYWPDLEELDQRDAVTDEAMPENTFFDGATVHLLTTATLDALKAAHPQGCFEIKRFRPNIVVQSEKEQTGFVENEWIGRTLAIGTEVRLSITGPCPRCVMTTLSQGDLPGDTGILQTALRQNDGHVGVYASVLTSGTIQNGDSVAIED